MLRFIILRPIALSMLYAALLLASFLAFRSLPLSLLPDIDVPEIRIKLRYPNASALRIEQEVLRPIRENLFTLQGIKSVESKAQNESGQIALVFDFQTDMPLAFVEVNEKIDQMLEQLPRELERPQVLRLNTADIPIIRLQVIPKKQAIWSDYSDFCEKILKRRLEQIEGLSLVELNAPQPSALYLKPNPQALEAYGIAASDIWQALAQQQSNFGNIFIKEGLYEYFVKIENSPISPEQTQQIPLSLGKGQQIRLGQVAEIKDSLAPARGLHFFQQKKGFAFTLHKQDNARLSDLKPRLDSLLLELRSSYPDVSFHFNQDQSQLLDLSIDNLQQSLFWGASLAFLVLFLFMANPKIPLMIGLSLPISLSLSFLGFYFLDISLNIISLSGLALGLGLLIDNAIVLSDNILLAKEKQSDWLEACLQGSRQVIAPLLSSVLTTLSVFVPLIFLEGLAGTLFYDQALALSLILGLSLLVAFTLLPSLHYWGFRKQRNTLLASSLLYRWLERSYLKIYIFTYPYRLVVVLALLLSVALIYPLQRKLELAALPNIAKKDFNLEIYWQASVGLKENEKRCQKLMRDFAPLSEQVELDLGESAFLRQLEAGNNRYAKFYFQFTNPQIRQSAKQKIAEWFSQHYPEALWQISDAANAFEQLFQSKAPWLELRLRAMNHQNPLSDSVFSTWQHKLRAQGFRPLPSSQHLPIVVFSPDYRYLSAYQLSPELLKGSLQQLSAFLPIYEGQRFGDRYQFLQIPPENAWQTTLAQAKIRNAQGDYYPLKQFIQSRYTSDYQQISADRLGIYHAFSQARGKPEDFAASLKSAAEASLQYDWRGVYMENQARFRDFVSILALSFALLYLILTAQFESFWQPLVVLSSLALALVGALAVLWLSAQSLNLMSGIGLVMMSGVMVNDAILKIDRINFLRKEGLALEAALKQAGKERLKPILMTSASTILALLPILWAGGLGADLQKPLVWAVIGGLGLGTFTALFLVPWLYELLLKLFSRKGGANV